MDATRPLRARKRLLVLAVAVSAAGGLLSPSAARAADAAPYRAVVLEHGFDTAKVVTLSFDADWSDAGVASVLST